MKVEVLYFEGCPGYEDLLPRLRKLIEYRAEVVLQPVDTPEEAERVGFLGSPTVRVNGRDVDPGAGGRTDYGMKCRLYPNPHGLLRTPPEEWILRALDGAA